MSAESFTSMLPDEAHRVWLCSCDEVRASLADPDAFEPGRFGMDAVLMHWSHCSDCSKNLKLADDIVWHDSIYCPRFGLPRRLGCDICEVEPTIVDAVA